MKKQFNEKLTATKKFVQTHKTKLALAAGATAGVAGTLTAVHYYNETREDLIIRPEDALHMLDGKVGLFETKFGTIMTLMNKTIIDQVVEYNEA